MSIDKIKEQLSHKYEFIELIGKGGFAEVYRAKDKMLEREVAIKILSGQYSRVAPVILAVLLSKKKDSETVAQAYELPFTNNLTKE
ncbi:MAG: hypothetical protein GY757_55405, partial [bacterium]|nr:hypothetical protein [bacterium]